MLETKTKNTSSFRNDIRIKQISGTMGVSVVIITILYNSISTIDAIFCVVTAKFHFFNKREIVCLKNGLFICFELSICLV